MVVYEPFPTVPLSEFHDELRFEWPELPAPLFDHYLLKTAVDMAEKGALVRRWVAIELEPGVTRYLMQSPDGMRLWQILGVRQSDCSFECSHEVRRSFVPPETCCVNDVAWFSPEDNVLHYSGCAGGTLYVSLSVVPERDACVLPRVYKDRYYSTLVMGARAHIMLITGQKWTNMRVGAELLNEYNRMLREDAVEVLTKGQRGKLKMQFGRVM
ncbi:MAG: hypothetical protein HDQ88_05650 [Clostridia bacterium]|nr:hypothetical protein [Clostridia bacterium]